MAQNLNYPINRAGGPVDDRTEVQHESDINSLESMYVGQLVHVIDNDKFFRIKSVDALGSPTYREVVAYTEITADKISSWDGKQDAITPENTLSPNNIKDVTMNGKLAAYNNNGVLGNSAIETTDVAVKSEMSITDGTGSDAGTATIQLKNGTSKKVLTQHQSLEGKVDKVPGKGLSTNDYDNIEKGKVANAIQMPDATENDKIPVMRDGNIVWESKPQNGAQGPQGEAGHNPCLGRLNAIPDDFDDAFQDAIAGDYVYVDIYDSTTQTTTTTVYHYVDDTNGWDDGTVINTDHPTFASSQAVTSVHIKNENGEDVVGDTNIYSEEAVNRLFEKEHDFFSIQGLTQQVRKCYLYEDTIHAESTVTLHTRIVINKGYKFIKVKTGLYSGTSANAITFFNGSTINTNNVLGYVKATPDGTYKTYIAEIPDNCDFIGVTYNESLPNYTIEVSGNAEIVSVSKNDNELLPHTKIESVCPYYRNSNGTEFITLSYFNDGNTVYTPIKYKVKAGDIITFDNPNNYLVAYWWYKSDNTVEQVWFGTTAQSSIRKVVPQNAIAVSFGFRLTSGLTFLTYVPIDMIVEHSMDVVPTENSSKPITSGGVYNSIQTLEGELDNKIDKYVEEDITDTADTADNHYILYASGKNNTAASSGLIKMYYFSAVGIKKVKVYEGWDGTTPAAIAFYSSTNFNPSNQFPSENPVSDGAGGWIDGSFMKSDSVQAITGKHWYEADVPEGAKWIAVANRGAVEESPQIIVLKSNTDIIPADVTQKIDESLKLARAGYSLNPFANNPHYYHFRPNNFFYIPNGSGGVMKSIASESLEDVEIAARLGFKIIEANIHKTSDNKFICIHGASGKLGESIKSNDESVITTANLQNSLISSLSLDFIKTYVVYNSDVVKYQTKIPTLEEFCNACKQYGMILFAGTEGIKEAVEICIRILGNNVIIYDPPQDIRDYFKGYVFTWHDSSSITKDNLLNTARNYGAPYMCGLSDVSINKLKNDNELNNLINEMHKENFLVGCGGVYDTEANVRDYFKRGFDFNGSGHDVNPFEHNCEIFDLDDNNKLPTLSGNGNISNGVITMEQGDILRCGANTSVSLGKECLIISFDGSLQIEFGQPPYVHGIITSNGDEKIVMTDYVMKKPLTLKITAQENTVITDFVFKSSVC